MTEEDKFLSDPLHIFPEGIFIPKQSSSIKYQHEFVEEWIKELPWPKKNRYVNKKKQEFLRYLYRYLDDIRYHSNYKQDRIVKEETE